MISHRFLTRLCGSDVPHCQSKTWSAHTASTELNRNQKELTIPMMPLRPLPSSRPLLPRLHRRLLTARSSTLCSPVTWCAIVTPRHLIPRHGVLMRILPPCIAFGLRSRRRGLSGFAFWRASGSRETLIHVRYAVRFDRVAGGTRVLVGWLVGIKEACGDVGREGRER